MDATGHELRLTSVSCKNVGFLMWVQPRDLGLIADKYPQKSKITGLNGVTGAETGSLRTASRTTQSQVSETIWSFPK